MRPAFSKPARGLDRGGRDLIKSNQNFHETGVQQMDFLTRRNFIRGAFAAGTAAFMPPIFAAAAGAKTGRILFGACLSKKKDVALMKSIGYDFCEGGVSDMVNPDKNGDWWKKKRDEIRALPLPVRSLVGFIPGRFRLTGEGLDHEKPLAYAEKAVRRAAEIGVKYIVLGSGAARNVPGKNPGKDKIEKGMEEFTDFCRKVAKRIEGIDGVTVVIEPLRRKECNIVNFVDEGRKIVEAVDSPKVRLLADIFHMMSGEDKAESIVKAGSMIKHCHVAEYSTRSFPGDRPGENRRLKPYFDALKKIGYTGGVSCECNWGKAGATAVKLETTLKTMKGLA